MHFILLHVVFLDSVCLALPKAALPVDDDVEETNLAMAFTEVRFSPVIPGNFKRSLLLPKMQSIGSRASMVPETDPSG